MYYDGCNGNDASDGQTAGVAHENLGWVCVVPQESNQCTHESKKEYNQFLGARYEHDVQIGGKIYMARNIGKYG